MHSGMNIIHNIHLKMNIMHQCKLYLTQNSQKISHNIYLTRLFYSVRQGRTDVAAGRTEGVCQVKHLDKVTIRIPEYLYTCIQFRIVSIP